MDTAFSGNAEARTSFLRLLMQSFGCTYICVWSYLPPPSNCLMFLDGSYQEEDNQPTSSSGSLARRLFDLYRQSPFNLDNNDRVPGLAFRTSVPYMELRELELQASASTDIQRQFYQEARIKKAVFMGCGIGEIELGFANETQQINMEMQMMNWLPEDFSRPIPTGELPHQPADPNRHSSSSSSLRSVSIDSPEYSSLLFNIPITTHIQQTLQDVPSLQPTPTTTSPHQQAMQAFARIPNIQLPNLERESAAMTRAILAVLTSPSSSSSSHQPQQNFPYNYPVNPRDSAFKNYASALAPSTTPMRGSLRRHSMLKRAISYYRSLNVVRRQHMLSSRPTSTQLHHMISERKRREKLNESFQALRSLLPPGTKKDKASVLTSTREYLSSLKGQVAELSQRNQLLEAQLVPAKDANEEASGSSNERLNVRVTHVSESTSEERIIDLQVTVRGESPIVDMVIRILEFLKLDKNASLLSMEANTRMAESTSFNTVILRLKVEGSEWDESAFQEAVRRVVADMTQ